MKNLTNQGLNARSVEFLRLFLLTLTLLAVSACGNPVKVLKKEIKKSGYILYQTPLEQAGSGTLIGGTPKSLSLIAHPQTCFPDMIDGEPTNFRMEDHATLADRYKKITTSASANVELINIFENGGGMLKVGLGFDMVSEMELEFDGVRIEYLDSVRITQFYANGMDPICKAYLDQVGFIIQALRVDTMSFKFKSNTGGYIDLTIGEIISEIVDISIEAEYRVINRYTLEITAPTYIGFQLGSLRSVDNGFALYRASKTSGNKYVFKTIGVFDDLYDDDIFEEDEVFLTKFFIGRSGHYANEDQFKELEEKDIIEL